MKLSNHGPLTRTACGQTMSGSTWRSTSADFVLVYETRFDHCSLFTIMTHRALSRFIPVGRTPTTAVSSDAHSLQVEAFKVALQHKHINAFFITMHVMLQLLGQLNLIKIQFISPNELRKVVQYVSIQRACFTQHSLTLDWLFRQLQGQPPGPSDESKLLTWAVVEDAKQAAAEAVVLIKRVIDLGSKASLTLCVHLASAH